MQLRLLQASVLVGISHECTDFYRRFTGGLQAVYRRICQERLQSGAEKANSALYANLATALFARYYAKSLIPRLGT
jgi:hypothetical protein